MARPRPGAAVLARGRGVGLAELLEQPADRLGGQADAGVAHRERELGRRRPFAVARHRQHDFAALGELDGVRQQVEQDLPQPRHVAAHRRRHVALEQVGEVELLLRGARADEVERRLDALAQIERLRLDVHAPGLDLREVEDVVDDGEQRVAGIADRRRVVALLVVERRVEQKAAHADHRVHRRADLVAHRREERALRLVGGLGLRARFLRLGEEPRVAQRDADAGGDRRQQALVGVVEHAFALRALHADHALGCGRRR